MKKADRSMTEPRLAFLDQNEWENWLTKMASVFFCQRLPEPPGTVFGWLLRTSAYGAKWKQIGRELVPSSDDSFPVIAVPELNARATGLPYLAYLLGESQMASNFQAWRSARSCADAGKAAVCCRRYASSWNSDTKER